MVTYRHDWTGQSLAVQYVFLHWTHHRVQCDWTGQSMAELSFCGH